MLLLGAFLTGFVVLLYEVTSTKTLSYFFSESTYATATVLAVFLFGLAIGSLIFGRISKRIDDKWKLFYVTHALVAVYSALVLPRIDLAPQLIDTTTAIFGGTVTGELITKTIISAIVLLIPTILLGMLFPLLILFATKKKNTGRMVSRVYSADLVGAVSGALLTGYFLLPQLGLSAALYVGVTANALLAILFALRVHGSRVIGAIAVFVVVLLSCIAFTNGYTAPQASTKPMQSGMLFHEESPYGPVDVYVKGDGASEAVNLSIDRRVQCDTRAWDSQNISEEHISNNVLSLAAKKPLRVLNIGLGCGLTAGTLASSDLVDQLDIVEINPVIPTAAHYFDEWNGNVLDKENVTLTIADGYEFLRANNQEFDLIVIDIEHPTVIHSSALYTLEFFQEVERSLSPDGVFALWAYRGSDDYYAILKHTLSEVFNSVTFSVSGIYKDASFYASNQSIDESQLNLTQEDQERLVRVQKLQDNAPLNTLDHQFLLQELRIE